MKRKGQFFLHLEEFNGSKYPTFIKNILKESAFDTEAALKTLENSSVTKIEGIVNENIKLVKDTVYVDNNGDLKKSPFKFLPGHEALILNIPLDLKKYIESKLAKKKTRPDIKDLKVSLKDKIKKYFENKKINLTIQPDDLTNFSVIDNRVRCLARCQICSIKVPCLYINSSWKNSNYCKHIVDCFNKKAQKNSNQVGLEVSAVQTRVEIQRANNSNLASKIIAEVQHVAR